MIALKHWRNNVLEKISPVEQIFSKRKIGWGAWFYHDDEFHLRKITLLHYDLA